MHVCLSLANIQSVSNWMLRLASVDCGLLFSPFDQPISAQMVDELPNWLQKRAMKAEQRVTSIQVNLQEKTSWNVNLLILNLSYPREHREPLALPPETRQNTGFSSQPLPNSLLQEIHDSGILFKTLMWWMIQGFSSFANIRLHIDKIICPRKNLVEFSKPASLGRS